MGLLDSLYSGVVNPIGTGLEKIGMGIQNAVIPQTVDPAEVAAAQGMYPPLLRPEDQPPVQQPGQPGLQSAIASGLGFPAQALGTALSGVSQGLMPLNSGLQQFMSNPVVNRLAGMAGAGYAAGQAQDPRAGAEYMAQRNAAAIQAQEYARQQRLAQHMAQAFPNGPGDLSDEDTVSNFMAEMLLGGATPQEALQLGQSLAGIDLAQAQSGKARRPPLPKYVKRKEGPYEVTYEQNPITGELTKVAQGDPSSLVTIEGDPTKKATAAAISEIESKIKSTTGRADPQLARAALNNQAFEDPMFGRYVYGNAQDRQQARFQVQFASGVRDMKELAREVIKVYGDTSAMTEATQGVAGTLGAKEATVAAYDQTRARVLSAFLKSRSGAQVSDREREFIEQMFPTVRELASGGNMTEAARRKFDGLTEMGRSDYMAYFHPDDVPAVEKQWERKVGPIPDDVADELLDEFERQAGRQPTPEEADALEARWRSGR